ncbi:carboxypeptidase-like regulatory domain-containing protein, partial [Lutibacter sp.]
MNKIIISIFCLFANLAFAQSYLINGQIIDQTSKMPLSFSTIEFKKASTGTYADTSGYFSLNIPKKYVNDSIEIYAIGYEKKKIPIKLFLKNNTEKIELSRKDFIIKEVKVKPKNSKLVTLGTRAKKPWRYQIANVFGSQIGHYIRNDKNIEG